MPQSKHGRINRPRSAELRNKFLNSGAKEAGPPHAPKASRGYGRLITDSKRTQPLPQSKPGRINRPRSAELRNKFLNSRAKEAGPPHAPKASRGYGRLITDSKKTQPLPQSKHGRTPLRRLAELHPHKIHDRVLAFLCEPLIRRALYYLLMLCLIIEEYLIRILLEE